MKKYYYLFLSLLAGLIPVYSFAEETAKVYISSWAGLLNVLNNIIIWGYRIFFIVAVGYILIAAYTYLTARDKAEQVSKANKSLIHAAIAVAVALLSAGFSKIIESFLEAMTK